MKIILLFTVGPVNVTENVRQAFSRDDIGHREEGFSNLLQSIEQKLLDLFGIKNIDKYRAVVITGSGTAANESVLSSVGDNKNILVLSNGEFGERLYGISKIYNQNTHLLKFRWGDRLNLEKINTYLRKRTIDIIAMVHHETSTGMLNPLEEVGSLSKAIGAKFIVDGVSSVGAETIDMEKCHIAFCTSSSSKAIGSYPGLSFVVGKKSEFNKLKRLSAKTNYLSLSRFYHYMNTVLQTPNTPAIPLFYALEQALINILIGNIGEISLDDIRYFLDSLDDVLQSFERFGNDQTFSIESNLILGTNESTIDDKPMLGIMNETTVNQSLKSIDNL